MTAALWLAGITLIVIGIAGTILPALPGAILVFGGIVLAASIDDFARIPVWLLVLLGALTSMARRPAQVMPWSSASAVRNMRERWRVKQRTRSEIGDPPWLYRLRHYK